MQGSYPEYKSRRAEIVAVAPADAVKDFWSNKGIPFPGIPDPDGRLGKAYRQERRLLKLGRMPALFVLNRQGEIVFSHYADSMADMPPVTDILKVLEQLS